MCNVAKPKMPAVAPPPVPTVATPTVDDAEVKAEEAKARKRAQMAAGYSGTILTSPYGDQTKASVLGTTLVGRKLF
jgi:hypothetical protein